jgi:hypothetical protein
MYVIDPFPIRFLNNSYTRILIYFKNKPVAFSERPRPLHCRYMRTGPCFRLGMAVTQNSRYDSEMVMWYVACSGHRQLRFWNCHTVVLEAKPPLGPRRIQRAWFYKYV